MLSVAFYHCRTADGKPSFVNIFHTELGDLDLHYAIECRFDPLSASAEFLIAVPRLSNKELELIDDNDLRVHLSSNHKPLEFIEGPNTSRLYVCTLLSARAPPGFIPILTPCTYWDFATDEDGICHEPVYRAPQILRR